MNQLNFDAIIFKALVVEINEVGKFLLGELQKEHHRARLSAAEAQAQQDQLGKGENAAAKSYNGFTLFLKDRLQSMAPGSQSLIAISCGCDTEACPGDYPTTILC